jgi:RNA polymerase sigma factor (sigma-70 family)
MDSQSNRPWQDDNGKMLSDENLRALSQGWDKETWDDYLKSLETPMRETLISDQAFTLKLDQQVGSFFELSQCTCSSRLAGRVSQALECLTQRQRQILQLTFWANKSERDIASQLGISRSTVKVMKYRAIKKLRRDFNSRVTQLAKNTYSEAELKTDPKIYVFDQMSDAVGL